MAKLKLILPYPVSVNHYWTWCRRRMVISKRGRAYRDEVILCCRQQGFNRRNTLRGRLAVEVRLIMPDRRIRDIDNVLKASLDALQHAAIYKDDNQIDDLQILRGPVKPPGKMIVLISELSDDQVYWDWDEIESADLADSNW